MYLPERKPTRLKDYDYSSPGAYFVTICTQDRKQILSKISIVGTGVLDRPRNELTYYGKIAEKQIIKMNSFYENISVDKFVVMPNHIHLLLRIKENPNGRSRMPVPTNAHSLVAKFVGTFKRFCNKEYGKNIWQERSHDHIIRGEKDYDKIWEYIDTNVIRWEKDCFFTEKGEDVSNEKQI